MPNPKRHTARKSRDGSSTLQQSGSGVSPLEKSRGGSSTLSYESGEQLLKRILEEHRKNWQGRGQYKEPTASDTNNLPQLPTGWTWANVEQLTTTCFKTLELLQHPPR